jgi:integrase
MFETDLQQRQPESLSRNLSREVSQALVNLGHALQQLASALGQGGVAPAPVSLSQSLTVAELVKEFLLAKARAGRSDRYLRALKNSLSKFRNGRANVPASAVTSAEIEKWLLTSEWSARTRKGYLSDVSILFNFAVRRGYVAKNPAGGVESPVCDGSKPPEIHSPDEVRRVLDYARRYDVNVCRALAVRYFAGLRSSEANRLSESEIGEDYIEVTAAKSKTRRRRLVKICPALRAWLAVGGSLPLGDANNRLRWFSAALLKAEGISWPHNVTRHSFCSYHLAAHGSAAKTALDAGHSESMLFAHYRELVKPEDAEEFWSIRPN